MPRPSTEDQVFWPGSGATRSCFAISDRVNPVQRHVCEEQPRILHDADGFPFGLSDQILGRTCRTGEDKVVLNDEMAWRAHTRRLRAPRNARPEVLSVCAQGRRGARGAAQHLSTSAPRALNTDIFPNTQRCLRVSALPDSQGAPPSNRANSRRPRHAPPERKTAQRGRRNSS